LQELDYVTIFFVYSVLLFSLSVHESAHAWTADRLGDSTSRRLGRISLNPMVHIDPVGTVILPVIAFVSGAPIIGWAKSVPVNISRLRRERRDFVLVAAAGPVSNILLAIAASTMLRLLPVATEAGSSSIVAPVTEIVGLAVTLNVLLAVFNMIPIPPLDGGNVLGGLLPDRLAVWFDRVSPYGFILLYILLLTGSLGAFLGPPYRFLTEVLTR